MGKNFDNARAGVLYRVGDFSQARLAFSSNEVETHEPRGSERSIARRLGASAISSWGEKKRRNSTWQFYCQALNVSVSSYQVEIKDRLANYRPFFVVLIMISQLRFYLFE